MRETSRAPCIYTLVARGIYRAAAMDHREISRARANEWMKRRACQRERNSAYKFLLSMVINDRRAQRSVVNGIKLIIYVPINSGLRRNYLAVARVLFTPGVCERSFLMLLLRTSFFFSLSLSRCQAIFSGVGDERESMYTHARARVNSFAFYIDANACS